MREFQEEEGQQETQASSLASQTRADCEIQVEHSTKKHVSFNGRLNHSSKLMFTQ